VTKGTFNLPKSTFKFEVFLIFPRHKIITLGLHTGSYSIMEADKKQADLQAFPEDKQMECWCVDKQASCPADRLRGRKTNRQTD
jgi:hypothetical protein